MELYFGAASVNGNTRFRRNYEPMLPGCFHVDVPWDYRKSIYTRSSKIGVKFVQN